MQKNNFSDQTYSSASTKKKTLVKPRVGCVKSSTYDLPEDDAHVYGMKKPEDPENAGEIISNWVTSNPSLTKQAAQMIVHSNVLAVKHGCITAHAMRKYAKEHPNIRMKESLTENSGRLSMNHEGPFGIKTKFADESMSEVLQAKFTNFVTEDVDYPIYSAITKSSVLPRPRMTHATESIQVCREEQRLRESSEKKRFIMKKFQNVPAVVDTRSREPRTYLRENDGGNGDTGSFSYTNELKDSLDQK